MCWLVSSTSVHAPLGFLDLDDSVRINTAWLYKEPKVSVLQGNVNLEVMGGPVYRDKGTPPKKGGGVQFYCYKTTLIPRA